ncbi:hypothetical protein ACRS7F_13500 [Brucella anthropi]
MYEIASMNAAIKQMDKKQMPSVSDSDWAQAEQLLAAATLNDPSVRLH